MSNIEEMKQEAKDAKDREKAEKAYNDSLTNTAPKPAPKPKKMAKGGVTSSASKRADGIAAKGKTKGTMIQMARGGAVKKARG